MFNVLKIYIYHACIYYSCEKSELLRLARLQDTADDQKRTGQTK